MQEQPLTIELDAPDDWPGFRAACRALLAHGADPALVRWRWPDARGTQQLGAGSDLFSSMPEHALPASALAGLAVPGDARLALSDAQLSTLRHACMHRAAGRFELCHRWLARVRAQPSLRLDALDADWRAIEALARPVSREIHKMHAFVRFRTTQRPGQPELHIAWFEPGHHIVRAAAPFFRDRFANMHWPDEEFKKEIEVVKEERRLRTEDQPRALLAEQLFATTFNASPYRRPVVGWMSDLDAMTPADVRAFHRQWYTPTNAVVVVAGDVQVDKVRALAEKYYGSLPAHAVPERKPRTEPEQRGLRRIAVKAPAEQAYVALAFRVPSLTRVQDLQASDRDALALLVLSAVFSGYDGARLERALTQGEQPVADSAGSSAMITGRGPALFLMTGVPAGGKTAQQVEDALRAELARVAREGISEAELARVKTQWIASTVYERDSVQNQAQELGSNWVQGFPLDAEERLLALLRTITAEEVQAVAAKYFGDDQLTIATLLPQPLEGARKRPAPAAGARH